MGILVALLVLAGTNGADAQTASGESRPKAPDSSTSRPNGPSKYSGAGLAIEWSKNWASMSVLAPQVVRLRLPRAEGDPRDAELRLYHFGPDGAGGDDANFQRWASWITPEEGKTLEDVTTRSVIRNGDVEIKVISVVGSYTPPSFSGQRHPAEPNSRLVGAIVRTPSGPYYLRVTGPKATIDAHYEKIAEMLRSASISTPGPKSGPDSTSRPASRPRETRSRS